MIREAESFPLDINSEELDVRRVSDLAKDDYFKYMTEYCNLVLEGMEPKWRKLYDELLRAALEARLSER
jgi:hypothetical protein